jgi:hypothetical protein
LYALALNLIESQPEICYQLLISTVETMAGAVLDGWEPNTEATIASKGALVSYATKVEKLSKDVAERLAVEACKGNPWSSKKFKKFLLDNLNHEAIASQDDLFIVPEFFRPKEEDIARALDKVYGTRSGSTHAGHSYPASASIGPSSNIPTEALDGMINQQRPFPPIGWFERVVNCSICGFLRSQVNLLVCDTAETRQ